MGQRLDLHNVLKAIPGVTNAYFQPPATIMMTYPCIVYSRSGENARYADDEKYNRRIRYTVTVIDRNPDSDIPDHVSRLQYCRWTNHMVVENLHHDSFEIIY